MSGIIFKNHKTEEKSLCEVSMKSEEGWEEVVIWNYVNIYRRMGALPPPPPPTHQSVLTGEPFMTQAASWGRRDVRRCLPTDLHSAVFTGRRLQTQPSIPRGVKKKPGT